MRIERSNPSIDKGWYAGPWNSDLEISIGYANRGINEPHVHSKITEIYIVARGDAQIRIEKETITITDGDIIIIEPGEAHTFLSSSTNYFHFVIHTPCMVGDQTQIEKILVTKTRLGL
jgi:mannose-6-phosphate isomerase-like protein (cupin superfamily)